MHAAILGAGPAGMSCANALRTFGLDAVVVERDTHIGGAQRMNFHENIWLLGSPEESGRQITDRMVRHFKMLPISLHCAATITRIHRQDGRFRLELAGNNGPHRYDAEFLVIATGTHPRSTSMLDGLASMSPRVIIGPVSDVIRDDIRGARVLILGGGDNALDHAVYLSRRGNQVTVCTRGSFSARPHFLTTCADIPAVSLHSHARIDRLDADAGGISALLPSGNARFDWLLVMYGYQPSTEVLEAFDKDMLPAMTTNGYILVDSWQRTSVVGIYAAGDITAPLQPSMVTAIAQGLTAARAIERDRQQPA